MVYLVPQDKAYREDYKVAIADAILHLQDFYQKELGNDYAFSLHQPTVEVYPTNHTASWYSSQPNGNNPAHYFYLNAIAEAFSLSGGAFDDPNYRWIYYIDADTACGQGIGGTSGIALLAANDLRGLTRQQNIPACTGQGPDNGGIYRWIGGLGHELGHAFNLPHPSGCDAGNCQGGSQASNSLMFVGVYNYPNTYFLQEDKTALLQFSFFTPLNLLSPTNYNFDTDEKSDVSVWKPTTGVWSITQSSTSNTVGLGWGANNDKIVPGDYDGDRKADLAVWRASNATWYILQSLTNTAQVISFGLTSDIPAQADYDGDRKTDLAIWRESDANWWIKRSVSGYVTNQAFGTMGDKPVASDYNGDKRTDIAVWRPSNGNWYAYNYYLNNVSVNNFGSSSDLPVQNDYDGDKKADIAVWRPSNRIWYILKSSDNSVQSSQWGLSTDIPASADYDGDKKADITVWRPDTGYFYILKSSNGGVQENQLGAIGDIPVAAWLLGSSGSPSNNYVSWINVQNTTSSGGTVTYNGPGYYGMAKTSQTISNVGYFEWTYDGKAAWVGLGNNNDESPSTATGDLNYAFSLNSSGGYDIRELGVYRAEGSVIVGDRLRLEISSNGTVTYKKNGALIRPSAFTASNFPYYLVFKSQETFGNSISNTVFSSNSSLY